MAITHNPQASEPTTRHDQSAFPVYLLGSPGAKGLTVREEFAKAALQGLAASYYSDNARD